jgi:hypothetical protein
MFSYFFDQLSPKRRRKVVQLGCMLMIGLYAFFVLIAEPMHARGTPESFFETSLPGGGMSSSFSAGAL